MTAEGKGYDAVVIGAGHNGLILATYLQRSGMRTLLVEQDTAVGGMTCTHEPMTPGFRHSPHANFLAYQSITPIVADFRLADHGLATISPEIQHGIAFADGRPPLVVHRLGHEAGTASSFVRYSVRDAAAYLDLSQRAATLGPSIREVLFHPLSEQGMARHREAIERAFGGVIGSGGLGAHGAAPLIDVLFESAEVRTLMYLLSVEFGASLMQPGNDLAFLGLVLWMLGNRQVPVGGMQSLANALHRAAVAEGVAVMTSAPVTRVHVEAGRVTGVDIAGKRVSAPIVASSVGVEQTLAGLLSGGGLGSADEQALATYRGRAGSTIASQAFALIEPPSYRSARWDPDIDRCVQTFIGFNDPESVLAHERDLAVGLLPPPGASIRVPSLWDAGLAPQGFHVAGADSHFPDAKTLSGDEWREIQGNYNDALLDTWRDAAPNMTPNNVLVSHFSMPRSGDRQVLLRQDSQYKTSIEGLYLCGTATYPGGGVHGACAINAFQEITGTTLS